MVAWHRSRRADLGLRATGLLLCWISYTALARLVGMQASPQAARIAAFGLAFVGFLGASMGMAMLLLGSHLFDQVKVSSRWRPRPDLNFQIPPEGLAAIDSTQFAMLVVGRNVDGSWTVRESAGPLLGRFSSVQAAQRFELQLLAALRTGLVDGEEFTVVGDRFLPSELAA